MLTNLEKEKLLYCFYFEFQFKYPYPLPVLGESVNQLTAKRLNWEKCRFDFLELKKQEYFYSENRARRLLSERQQSQKI